jgi:hypothetical protein
MKRIILVLILFYYQNDYTQWVKVDTKSLTDSSNIDKISSLDDYLFIGTTYGYFSTRNFVSGDDGISWKEFTLNETGIKPFIHDSTRFVTILGYHFVSKNDGKTWEKTYGPNSGNPKYILAVNDMILVDTLLFASTGSGIMTTGWNNPALPWYGNLSAWSYLWKDIGCFSFVKKNDSLFLSTSKGIFVTTDKGNNWILFTLENVPVTKFCIIESHIIAVTKNTLYYSSSEGNSWNKIDFSFEYLQQLVLTKTDLFALAYSEADKASYIWKFSLHDILTEVGTKEVLQKNYLLSQNYPNPFNPSTTIQFSIPSPLLGEGQRVRSVTLKVYDVLGREVVTLVNETKQPGNYEVKFEGANLPSGVYFYKLTAGDFVQTKKMILIR